MIHSLRRGSFSGRLWFVAAALLSLPPCIDATGDPDLWWHLRTGQWIADHLAVPHTELYSYTAPGAPWVAHEWLSELLFWLVNRGIRLTGLAVVVGVITWSGLLALAWLGRRRGASGLTVGLLLLLGAKAMQPVTGTRPQMLTFALLCWTLLLLDCHLRHGGRRIWLLIPLVLLWANLHAGFAVGLAVAAVVIGAAVLDALWQRALSVDTARRLVTAAAAVVLAAAAALLNPNGVDLYRLAMAGSTPTAHRLIQEWQHPDLASWAMVPLVLLMAATVALMLANRHHVRPSHVVLTVLGIGAALLAVRNIAIAVALLSPTAAELATVRYRLPRRPIALPAIAVVAALAVAVLSGFAVATTTRPAALARAFPACLVDALRATGGPVQLWLPYGQGGYAIAAAWPEVRVYAYGEDTTLGPKVLDNYVRIAAGDTGAPSAVDLLERSGTNAVITPAGRLSAELAGAGWREAGAANGETLYLSGDQLSSAAVSCRT